MQIISRIHGSNHFILYFSVFIGFLSIGSDIPCFSLPEFSRLSTASLVCLRFSPAFPCLLDLGGAACNSYVRLIGHLRGCSSVVEHLLAKERVESSTLCIRFNIPCFQISSFCFYLYTNLSISLCDCLLIVTQ